MLAEIVKAVRKRLGSGSSRRSASASRLPQSTSPTPACAESCGSAHCAECAADSMPARLNAAIERFMAKLDVEPDPPVGPGDDECVVCRQVCATVRTFPCAHRVLCRRCMAKMVQISIQEGHRHIGCVVCRTPIARVRKQVRPVRRAVQAVDPVLMYCRPARRYD